MRSLCRILPWLGAVLLGVELVIFVLGFCFPRETRMYREFYITRSRDCWLPADVEAAVLKTLARPEIDPPALDANAACYVLAHGWNLSPPWGETTQGQTAWLDLPPLLGAKALDMTLANTSPQNPQIVLVSLGQWAMRVTLPAGQVPVLLHVPLAVRPGEDVRLRFDRPDEPDGNPMAVLRLKWMEE